MNESLFQPSVGTGGIVSLLGYLVVFFGLILLMLVVIALGKVMAKRAVSAPAASPASFGSSQSVKPAVPAPGTAGKLKLYDVPDRDAAMVMAIVANRIGKPLNELRFRSIKEVK